MDSSITVLAQSAGEKNTSYQIGQFVGYAFMTILAIAVLFRLFKKKE